MVNFLQHDPLTSPFESFSKSTVFKATLTLSYQKVLIETHINYHQKYLPNFKHLRMLKIRESIWESRVKNSPEDNKFAECSLWNQTDSGPMLVLPLSGSTVFSVYHFVTHFFTCRMGLLWVIHSNVVKINNWQNVQKKYNLQNVQKKYIY